MNKEEAIEYLKNYKYDNEVRQAIDTVLNYIEKLENRLKEKENIVKKSSLEAQKYFDMLMEVEYGRDTIPKQKIRNKIEEWDKSIKWNNADDHYYAIKILKELLDKE